MSLSETEVTFASWRQQFVGLDETELHRDYLKWQMLTTRARKMRGALANTKLLPKARENLALAERKLDFSRPYRIVVLGESGAGKSTTINALIGQDRLTTGAGAAITGTPVYVHPLTDAGEEHVVVTYRDQQAMLRLAVRIAKRYDLELPSSLPEVAQQLQDIVDRSTVSEEKRVQLIEDLKDIVDTAARLETRKLLGEKEQFSPDSDARFLTDLMDETSPINAKDAPTRAIAGISRIDYFLRSLASSADSLTGVFASVVFVDTPGIGARTFRHQEILEDEVENADAVILVVNANRPEDKTAGMAHLLNQALLGVFSPEQKEYFAQKVFVVVNKIDALGSNDDRRRLDQSITELTRIISPNYWSLHVAVEQDRRYFETIGQLAVLAQIRLMGGQLEQDFDKIYHAYSVRLLTETQRAQENAVELALTASNIPAFRLQLVTFLSLRRIGLMLREAEELLDQTIRVAQTEVRQLFTRYGLAVDDRADSNVLIERNIREVCLKQLQSDKKALADNYEGFWKALQAWRRGEGYKESLTAKVREICSDIDYEIDRWLETKLSDPTLFTRTLDATSGKTYVEMTDVRFLYEAERETRRLVEHQGAVLADYYLSEFARFVRHHEIYELLIEKAYGQSYLFDPSSPESELRHIQGVIAKEFVDICRWVSVYELMQDPLLNSKGQDGEITPEVATEVSKFVIDIVAASFDPTGVAVPAKVAASGMSRIFGSFSRKPGKAEDAPVELGSVVSSIEVRTERRREFSSKLQNLRRDIEAALDKNDVAKIRQLVGRELAVRSKNALGASLPYLDMLFFYELEKFQREYETTAESMLRKHEREVLDRNEAIRQVIVVRNRATIEELSEALAIVNRLRAASTT
jgi:signal recognition particle receptor subunit beta